MVTNPIIVATICKFGSVMTPEATHIPIKIKENSLICPRDIPVKKLFFFVCPINQRRIVIINGFPTRTKADKTRI